jgi:hypothetical protein
LTGYKLQAIRFYRRKYVKERSKRNNRRPE